MTLAALAEDQRYPLNRSETAYLSVDGMVGSLVQPYLMRLEGALDEAVVRQALRDLVSAYSRLRAVVEPGLHLHHLRVLPDDHIVDELFEVAWRVEHGLDADDHEQMLRLHNQTLNDVVSLQRGLGMRVRFVPHPVRPVLIFSVHHLLLDGRSLIMAMSDLLKRLNGQPIVTRPMEAPSMIPCIGPKNWREWPVKLWASFKIHRDQKHALSQLRVIKLPRRSAPHYSANAVEHHVLSTPVAAIKQAAKRAKTTINTFMLTAVTETFLELEADDPRAAVVIRMSVDMRRFYPREIMPSVGNFVATFLVAQQRMGSTSDRIHSLDVQIKEGLGRFIRRERCWNYLLEESFGWFGRTLYTHLALTAHRAGKLSNVTCHMSNLTGLDQLNAADAAVRLVGFFPTTPSLEFLVGSLELGGRMYVTMSWQLSDTDRAVIRSFADRLDRTVARLVTSGN